MAEQTPNALYSVFGLMIWGDLGHLTLYRSKRGKIVVFAKTWPKKPASPAQQEQRYRIMDAADDWQQLTAPQRHQWELASRRASLCMNGYNLWVHWHMTQDTQAIRTLERQTHTTLLPEESFSSSSGPPWSPSSSSSGS